MLLFIRLLFVRFIGYHALVCLEITVLACIFKTMYNKLHVDNLRAYHQFQFNNFNSIISIQIIIQVISELIITIMICTFYADLRT